MQLDTTAQRQRVFGSARKLHNLVARQGISVFRSPDGTKGSTKLLRVGVYTGSFDPVHRGHQAVTERMRAQYHLDLIYVVPDRVTSYKQMAAVAHREQMIVRQFQGCDWVKLLTAAMQAIIGPGEMWDILRVVQEYHPGAEIFNIMGSDAFAWYRQLPLEHRLPRSTILINDRHDGIVFPETFDGKPVHIVTDLDQGWSSTKVRDKICCGETPEELSPEVWDYIRDHGLYR